jgi:hypothetical protein
MKKYQRLFNIYALLALGFILQHNQAIAQVKVVGTKADCDKNNGTASVSSTGVAASPITYKWSNGKTTSSIDKLAPGNYSVTVTDGRDCKGTGSFRVFRQRGGLNVSLNPPEGASFVFPCSGAPPKIPLSPSAKGGLGQITFSPAGIQYAQGNGTFAVSARDKEGFCTGRAEVTITFTPSVCSRDPNEIIGPKGYGDAHYVASALRMPYTILFENDPVLATAPAQKVSITHKFDPKINRSSLKLGDFGFSGMIFNVPPNTSTYSTRLDLRDSLGFFVDVTAGINIGNNTAFWIFQTIDPATGLPPFNPYLGFLPVNDSTGNGEGFVSFTVNPKINVQSGDTIKAEATIIFDINSPIVTNTFFNVADAGMPSSHVNTLSNAYDTTMVQLSFSSQDDPSGSGIASVELWVSENEGGYIRHGVYPPDTVIAFIGTACNSYRFFSIAFDQTGNMEADKDEPDASTTLMPKPVFTTQPQNTSVPANDSVSVTALASGATIYQWEGSSDGGFTFFLLENNDTFSGVDSPVLHISNTPLELNGTYFRCQAGNGSCSEYSEAVNLLIMTTLSGRLLYDNSLQSPISNSMVFLHEMNGNLLDSASSNAAGNFYFLEADPGQYIVKNSINKTWGGVNATDALRVLLHFSQQLPLNGNHLAAADVNSSGSYNAIDALLIAKRFAALIESFPSGDWYSKEDTVNLGIGNVTLTQSALCYGDVDGSFIPALKTTPKVALQVENFVMVNPGEVIEVPLISLQDFTAGAISLVINYPANFFHIEEVKLKNQAFAENLVFSAKDGILRIAWFNREGLQIDFRDAFLVIKMRATEKPIIGKLDITVEDNSEVSDPKGNVQDLFLVEIPELKSSTSSDALTLAQNFPNPFNNNTEISYYLPESGKVKLRVYNPLGQLVTLLVDEIQPKGYFSYHFSETSMGVGVYAVQLEFENASGKKCLHKLMTKAY